MIYIPDITSDRPTEWDIRHNAAYDHGYAQGLKGLPALKWRESHGSHCSTAAIAYKNGRRTALHI